jgi:hypothetical protein
LVEEAMATLMEHPILAPLRNAGQRKRLLWARQEQTHNQEQQGSRQRWF